MINVQGCFNFAVTQFRFVSGTFSTEFCDIKFDLISCRILNIFTDVYLIRGISDPYFSDWITEYSQSIFAKGGRGYEISSETR